jgi:hypothetical protein
MDQGQIQEENICSADIEATVADHDTGRTGDPSHWARYVLVPLLLMAGALAATALARPGIGALMRLRDLLEYVAGVFALLALTEAVLSGVAAAERLVPVRFRIVIQTAHRATTAIALGFLTAHVLLKVTEGHAAALDAIVPFYGGHGLYVGLGTVAADLLVLVVVTGLSRARFAASRWPWAWRSSHVLAYALWPLALLHGLLAGRAAKPWVVIGYVACAAAVLLAIASRLPRMVRERREVSTRVSGRHARVPDPLAADAGAARTDDRHQASLRAYPADRPGDRR